APGTGAWVSASITVPLTRPLISPTASACVAIDSKPAAIANERSRGTRRRSDRGRAISRSGSRPLLVHGRRDTLQRKKAQPLRRKSLGERNVSLRHLVGLEQVVDRLREEGLLFEGEDRGEHWNLLGRRRRK